MAGGRPRRRRSSGAGGRRRVLAVGQGAGGRRVRFRKKSHFRTPSRPIQLKIRDDTIRPGAELQNSPFPHRAVRSPDSYTVIILLKSSTSYAISDLSIHATAAPPMHPEIRLAAELFFVQHIQNVYDSSDDPSAEIYFFSIPHPRRVGR